ncbi:MAG: dNTP triphosphohydrolase [Desulfuromonadales bacterium]|nr:dNTP triphosphohydrolase [Desulfuromonadales bacterium]
MSDKFAWPKLLSTKRVGTQETDQSESNLGVRTEFESDYDRVVFSAPFRRLAKKTQVHPLAPNDHVHNRLIHSIEVGSVGRSLGKKLQIFLHNSGIDQEICKDLPKIVQVGCLVHDIGNPPFGHAGEYAIREWIGEHQKIVFNKKFTVSEETKTDLMKFEGNAQGFRLASRKDNKSGYMRLTYASLGAMIKYPWCSSDDRAEYKYNIFSSEKKIFEGMAQEMGLVLPTGRIARHPLSFLTEAADDICYRMLDMEDAVSMRIFPEEPIVNLFLKIANFQEDRAVGIAEARGRAIGQLIDAAWRVFEDNYDSIMTGGRESDLKAEFSCNFEEEFKEIDRRYKEIFSHRSKLAYEIGSYKILGRITKSLVLAVQALCEERDYDKLKFISQKCFELSWGENYVKANQNKDYEWWLRQIFDYISGLTDNYAIQISNEIEGIILV